MAANQNSRTVSNLLFGSICFLVFLYLIFPLAIVIPISFSSAEFLQFPPKDFSFRWYHEFFTTEEWLNSTLQSIKVGVLTALLSTVLGTLAAFGLVRGKFKGKNLVQLLIMLPMIIPQIIFAIGIYFVFAKWHLLGKTISLALGHLPLALPFVVITVSASLYGFDISLEEAASTLGANRIKTFYLITYPIIQPGILVGAIFAFIISFDELIVAVFICGSRVITLPKMMFDCLRFEISPIIASISTLLILLAILVLIGVTTLKNKVAKRMKSS